MRILADENMPLVRELFQAHGDIELRPGRQIRAEHLRDKEVLLVRSVTRVNAELLSESALKFVGSATIGDDHIDRQLLLQRGISFANAPGCNANAVAEYVVACLDEMQRRDVFNPDQHSIAIIGYGNVGKRLAQKLLALGWSFVVHDPPLLATGFTDASVRFVSKAEALQAQVVSLHVPLQKQEPWSTRYWIGEAELRDGRFHLLLNTCRGPVVDNQALLQWLLASSQHQAVLDVWEHEPNVDADLLANVAIATPHIAGYSLEGRTNGSFAVYQAFCKHFELNADIPEHLRLPVSARFALPATAACTSQINQQLLGFLGELYQPKQDDRRMREALANADDVAVAFDLLRKQYPVRRELYSSAIEASAAIGARYANMASMRPRA